MGIDETDAIKNSSGAFAPKNTASTKTKNNKNNSRRASRNDIEKYKNEIDDRQKVIEIIADETAETTSKK